MHNMPHKLPFDNSSGADVAREAQWTQSNVGALLAAQAAVDPDVHRPDVLPHNPHTPDPHTVVFGQRRTIAVGELYKWFPGPKCSHRRFEKQPLALRWLAHHRKARDDRTHAARVAAKESGKGERVAFDNTRERERAFQQGDKLRIAFDEHQI